MKALSSRKHPLAVAVAVSLAAFAAASPAAAHSPMAVSDATSNRGVANIGVSHLATSRYIVRFAEPSLAMFNERASRQPVNGITSIPTTKAKNGRVRLDVHSAQAKSYVAWLKSQQSRHVGDIAAALGRAPAGGYAMQHALNAVVLELSADDARKVAAVPGVVAVERERIVPLATDIGPGFIGAASVWWGTPAGQDSLFASGFDNDGGYRGDGVVVGDIDTGYNSMSPSFQATDAGGYTITNPLGSGVFLGQCNVPDISLGGCNDKVIGAYDEIGLTGAGAPYSVEDTEGHGSHTASTAAGNTRSATLLGYTASISGVAPHANLIIYRACDANGCPTTATTASVDQAVADGVVDAINYSISGGQSPWGDSTSLAFLGAEDAGIFVAAAAGNTDAVVPDQVPGTANHAEPWVATVAAGNHTGGPLDQYVQVTGPGSPPSNVQHMPVINADGDTPATSTVTSPLTLSPYFDISDTNGDDGCGKPAGAPTSPQYPANVFAGSVAVISRGTCNFSVKVANAVAAGAIGVIIVDNRPEGPFTPIVSDSNTPQQPIPVWSMVQTDGLNLQAWLAANSNTAPGTIPFPTQRLPAQPDELADFSLLGPVSIDVVKPDLQGPGVAILAAIANDGSMDGPNLVALYNGTSMATPHTTGSGALLAGLHPDWSPSEIKSALMMTAKEAGLTKADGTTPSDPFDRGAGRLQDLQASNAGLVLDETAANYAAADPELDGDPSTLNEPSMQSANCITVDMGNTSSAPTCSFTRTFTSTQDHAVNWSVSFNGVSAVATPTMLSVGALGQGALDVTVDASALPPDGAFHFGEMVLTPDDPTLPPLHLPIAVRIPPPKIAVDPGTLPIDIPNGMTTASVPLTVANVGGLTLAVTDTNDATSMSGRYVVVDQPSQGNYGYYSDLFTDYRHGFYAADDFVTISPSTNLKKLTFPGFMVGPTPLAGFPGANIHFEIYADAGGMPDGNPESKPTKYLYSYVATVGTTPGLDVTNDTISIDFAAAGAPATALPAGHYWMVVWPELSYSAGAWVWFESLTTVAYNAHNIDPANLSGSSTGTWIDNVSDGEFPGMAMQLDVQVACGAPWLGAAPPSLSLGGKLSDTVTVTVDSTQFGGGSTASGYLCLDSNDADSPVLAIPVVATQN